MGLLVEEPHRTHRDDYLTSWKGGGKNGMRARARAHLQPCEARPAMRASVSRLRSGWDLSFASFLVVGGCALRTVPLVFPFLIRYTYVSTEMLTSDTADSLHREFAKQYWSAK